jgi:hypothetical protein
MGSKSSEIERNTYYVGVHFVLCLGAIDKITEIIIDKKVTWTGNLVSGASSIDEPDLFGGGQYEGGVYGDFDLDRGLPNQTINTYLNSVIPPIGGNPVISAFRGVTSLILKKMCVGTNYYMKPWAIRATRIHTRVSGQAQWNDSYAEPIVGTLNGVHIVRECLTDPEFGLGISESLMGSSFAVSAITAFNEGLGFAFFWNKETSIQDFILEVLKHLQGSLYQDRITGKYELTLIRKVSDPTTLLSLNEANIQSVDNFHRLSVGELPSTVVVKYTDPITGDVNSITVTNPALAQRQSTTITKTIDYLGITSKALAHKIAIREINQQTVPILTCSIKCNRDAESLNKGDAFLLTWSDFLDQPIVMRVNTMNLGTPSSSTITIEAIQDVFTAPTVVYTEPPESNWENPIKPPLPISYSLALSAPYYFLARVKGDTIARLAKSYESFLLTAAGKPAQSSIKAAISTSPTSTVDDYSNTGYNSYCFVAKVNGTLDTVSTNIPITNITNLSYLRVGSVAVITSTDDFNITGNIDGYINTSGNDVRSRYIEYVQVTGINSDSIDVKRGVLDTAPKTHLSTGSSSMLASAFIFGIGDDYGYCSNVFGNNELTHYALLDISPKGTLTVGEDRAVNGIQFTEVQAKHYLPLPASNIKFNSLVRPTSINVVNLSQGKLPFSCSLRNRVTQTSKVLTDFYTSIYSNEDDAISIVFTLTTLPTSDYHNLTYMPEGVIDLSYNASTNRFYKEEYVIYSTTLPYNELTIVTNGGIVKTHNNTTLTSNFFSVRGLPIKYTSSPTVTVSAISVSLISLGETLNKITLTTATGETHSITAGQRVRTLGFGQSVYNGVFNIYDVTATSISFTIDLASAPNPTGSAYFEDVPFYGDYLLTVYTIKEELVNSVMYYTEAAERYRHGITLL